VSEDSTCVKERCVDVRGAQVLEEAGAGVRREEAGSRCRPFKFTK